MWVTGSSEAGSPARCGHQCLFSLFRQRRGEDRQRSAGGGFRTNFTFHFQAVSAKVTYLHIGNNFAEKAHTVQLSSQTLCGSLQYAILFFIATRRRIGGVVWLTARPPTPATMHRSALQYIWCFIVIREFSSLQASGTSALASLYRHPVTTSSSEVQTSVRPEMTSGR